MRITKLDLNQINVQLERLEELHKRLAKAESMLDAVSFQTSQLDFTHARPTVNNLNFTWTGSTGTISWPKGWIKDKNALTDSGQAFSQAPSFKFGGGPPAGLSHNIPVLDGAISSLIANTYYWLAWNSTNNQMYVDTDVTKLYSHRDMQVICQVFTGTGGQTGTVGGGGSRGGTELSGAQYKLF